ncbi:UNVERIFIED_ORG: DNA-binding MltR family transcriptional regulator [Rhizobium esperanzae]
MSKAKNDKTEQQDPVFGDLNRLQKTIEQLDERGLILALAAFAEEALGDLINAFLIPGDPAKQLLEGFNAPLGTFSARIKMAYSLGLVTKGQYADLDRLRRIRNDFAHTWEPISFSDQKIADHIRALRFRSLSDEFPTSLTDKVRTSLGTLLIELRSITHQITKRGFRAKVIGQTLIAGVVGDLDDQIATCRTRLIELAEELKSASGERRRFLFEARYQWEGKLEIVRVNAPRERQQEIRTLQAELNAWNIPPEDQ